MTWDEMGRIAYEAHKKQWDERNAHDFGDDYPSIMSWDQISDFNKSTWIETAKALYNAAAGDLAERIGQEGL